MKEPLAVLDGVDTEEHYRNRFEEVDKVLKGAAREVANEFLQSKTPWRAACEEIVRLRCLVDEE
jgi:hypothetical protein